MRAFRIMTPLTAPTWEEVPEPTPGPGEVVLRVSAVGLCRSDLDMQEMPAAAVEPAGWKFPFTLGHEIAGEVAALGEGVDHLSVGEPVVVLPASSCGKCWYCLRGAPNNCSNAGAGRGFGDDGGLADFVLVKNARDIVPLGGLDPIHAAPLGDAGSTAYHGVDRIRGSLTPESTVVVFGAGGLGSFAIQFLRAVSPAFVVSVDMSAEKLAMARELGAHETFEGVNDSTLDQIRELTDGRGADALLDFVGIDQTIATGIAAVRPGGKYGLVGAGGGRLATSGEWFHLLPRDGEVFTYQGSTVSNLESVMALARRGMIQSPVEVFSPDDIETAYAKLRDGSLRGRAVIDFARS